MSTNTALRVVKDMGEACCGWVNSCKGHELKLQELNTSGHIKLCIGDNTAFLLTDEEWSVVLELWEELKG